MPGFGGIVFFQVPLHWFGRRQHIQDARTAVWGLAFEVWVVVGLDSV